MYGRTNSVVFEIYILGIMFNYWNIVRKTKMKDKYLIGALMILIPVNVVLTYRNIKNWKDDHFQQLTKLVRVLPNNKDKELKDPKEVRQYVGAIAEREGLNVGIVDRVVNCESRYRVDARSRTGKYLGLYQISSIHNVSDECRLDAQCSTKWFVEKVKRDGNYLAWECYQLTI